MAVLDTRRPAPKQDIDVIAAQWDSFDRAVMGTRKWADGDPVARIPGARTCIDFLRGRQWDPEDIAARTREGRPIITLNKIKPIVMACKGYYRSNRYELKYTPGVDGTSQPEISTILTKLSKATDEVNKSKWVDAAVFDDGIASGRGFWDTRLDFSKNRLGEIRERRLNPFQVHIDPEAEGYDPETWNEVTVEHWMTWDDIVATYGIKLATALKPFESLSQRSNGVGIVNSDADTTYLQPAGYFGQFTSLADSETDLRMNGGPGSTLVFSEHWNATRRLFRVLDRQHYRRVQVTRMVDMQSGGMRVLPHEWSDDDIRQAVQEMTQRGVDVIVEKATQRRVKWTVSCLDVLLFNDWSPYSTPTVTGFFPDFQSGVTRGLIHDIVDPQREVNAKRASEMHFLATSANPGWMYPEGSLSPEQQVNLRRNGGKPGFKLEYRVVSGGAPSRIQPGQGPAAWERLEAKAADDIEQLAGFNKSAIGQLDRVQSGRAIEARQRAAIGGLEPYFDAFALSMELKGRKRLEIYQNFYTEPRIVTLTVKDQKQPEQVAINQVNAIGEIVNGVSDGTFSATVDQVPISKSYEDGVFQETMEIAKMVPGAIPPARIIKLSGIPGKEEILAEMEEASKNAPPSPDVLKLQNEAQKMQLDAQAGQEERRIQMAKLQLEDRALAIKEQELGIKRDKVDGDFELKSRQIESDGTSAAADRAQKATTDDRKLDLEEAKIALGNLSLTAKVAGDFELAAADRAHAIDMIGRQQSHETRRSAIESVVARGKQRAEMAHQAGQAEADRNMRLSQAEADRAMRVSEAAAGRQHASAESAAAREAQGEVEKTRAAAKAAGGAARPKPKKKAATAKPAASKPKA